MGQKINPIGLRLGINRTWDSRWYANKGEYGNLLQEDLNIRRTLLEDLKQTEREQWQRQFDRELSTFADEAFLSRPVLAKLQSKKRTGA